METTDEAARDARVEPEHDVIEGGSYVDGCARRDYNRHPNRQALALAFNHLPVQSRPYQVQSVQRVSIRMRGEPLKERE